MTALKVCPPPIYIYLAMVLVCVRVRVREGGMQKGKVESNFYILP